MDGENANAQPGADVAPTNPDGGQPLDGAQPGPGQEGIELGDDGLPIHEEKKEVIPIEVLEDMKNVFDVFDLQKTDRVLIGELRTIMRALDFDLSPAELKIVRKRIDPDEEGFIRFANLKLVMEEKLKDIDTFEDLVEEFKHLDKNDDGQIPNPEFKQYMMNMGNKMTAEELEELMKEADPSGDGVIVID